MESEAKKQSRSAGRATARKNAGTEDRDANLGTALRSAYDAALKEDIPSEMLDLLGKLA